MARPSRRQAGEADPHGQREQFVVDGVLDEEADAEEDDHDADFCGDVVAGEPVFGGGQDSICRGGGGALSWLRRRVSLGLGRPGECHLGLDAACVSSPRRLPRPLVTRMESPPVVCRRIWLRVLARGRSGPPCRLQFLEAATEV